MQVKKEKLAELACDLVNNLEKKEKATVVALFGELGSGKTAFTKEAGRAFGIRENIISPTFVIEKVYRIGDSRFQNLIHIDTYRLESTEGLKALGWDEIIENSNNVIFIEWPENIKEALPEKRTNIYFKYIDEETRKIEIETETEKQ